MSRPIPQTVPAREVPEVLAFLKAQRELAAFKTKHPTLFRRLSEIADVYNATLEAADRAVRARRLGCGPFDLYQFSARVDDAALCAAIGRTAFTRFGGVISWAETFTFDRKQLEALIAMERISPEIEAAVVTYSPAYHKPDKLLVP
jgi:hypothetical protein